MVGENTHSAGRARIAAAPAPAKVRAVWQARSNKSATTPRLPLRLRLGLSKTVTGMTMPRPDRKQDLATSCKASARFRSCRPSMPTGTTAKTSPEGCSSPPDEVACDERPDERSWPRRKTGTG
jgi:hypothetical protein